MPIVPTKVQTPEIDYSAIVRVVWRNVNYSVRTFSLFDTKRGLHTAQHTHCLQLAPQPQIKYVKVSKNSVNKTITCSLVCLCLWQICPSVCPLLGPL